MKKKELLMSGAKLQRMLDEGKLFNLTAAADIADYCVRYVRILCHRGKVDCHKFFGCYYFTPEQVSALRRPAHLRSK